MVALVVVAKGMPQAKKRMNAIDKAKAQILEREKRRHAFIAERRVKQMYRGRMLRVRSGNLIRSVNTRGHGAKSKTWEVGTPVEYAKSHERGATIRPKHGGGRMVVTGRRADGSLTSKMSKGTKLAIPLDAAKTKAGVTRSNKIDRIALDLSRGRPFTTFVSKSGKALMLAVGNEVTPIAALVDRVRLKRKPTFGRVTKLISKLLPKRTQVEIQKMIKQKGAAR
jgi:hypothetical protein